MIEHPCLRALRAAIADGTAEPADFTRTVDYCGDVGLRPDCEDPRLIPDIRADFGSWPVNDTALAVDLIEEARRLYVNGLRDQATARLDLYLLPK